MDASHLPLIRSKDVSDYVYASFKHFGQINEYKEIGWFGFMSLDKVGKQKDEFRDLNSQLRCHINALKASMGALKKTFISYSCGAETAENQTQNLTL